MSVLRTLRRTFPQIGVIVLTGYASIETAKESIRLGALDYYLEKPLTPEALTSIADEALSASRRVLSKEEPVAEKTKVESAPVSPHAPAPGPVGSIGMMLATPFVGLLYILLFPIIGLGAIIVLATARLFRHAEPEVVVQRPPVIEERTCS